MRVIEIPSDNIHPILKGRGVDLLTDFDVATFELLDLLRALTQRLTAVFTGIEVDERQKFLKCIMGKAVSGQRPFV